LDPQTEIIDGQGIFEKDQQVLYLKHLIPPTAEIGS
jgi:hypothetical protein